MTKIKHIWSVLCKESVINKDDNNISIFGTLEELSVFLSPVKETGKLPEKYGIPMSYEIVSFWVKEKEKELVKAQIEYSLISPQGKELFNKIQDMEMQTNIKRFRSRMKIAGLPITREGNYKFQVKIKEEGAGAFRPVAELPLEVKINLQKTPIKPQTKN